MPRLIKLRWRRQLRQSQKQVEDISLQAGEQIERQLLRRFDRLIPVRRFVIGWVGLIIIIVALLIAENFALSGYYQTLASVPGGIYNEGVQGTFTNANPLYATTVADQTVSSLVFASLLKTDQNGKLVGDLASSYSVDAQGTTYTVRLRPHLKWQDGQPLTSRDVVFTYNTIANPDAGSPLFSNWQGINVSAPDANTVVFKLPDVLAAFPYNLTNGLVPAHLLSKIPAADLRSADFNTVHPIGSGPFAWQDLNVVNGNDPTHEQVQIGLKPFTGYALGTPKLDKFVVQIYADQTQLDNAFASKQLTGLESSTPPPLNIQNASGVTAHSFVARAANMVFFKTSTGVLADSSVRKALVQGANVPQIINNLGYLTHAVNEPLLTGQLGYNPAYKQAAYNLNAAEQLLASDGWTVGSGGIRQKNNQPLTFTLTAADTPENGRVTKELQQDWQAIGVKLNLQLLDPTDYQSALSYHQYDAILAGISIGVDPDVFVYWDSSQADIRSANRLNFSEYKNPTADNAIEAGRTRLNPSIRVIKYQPFLQAWQQDYPALGLYQPRLLYLTNGNVSGLSDQAITNATDRLANVQNWEILQGRVSK